ncbi:MAG: hypothetical protein LBQ67_00455 [Treponema sp.]|nr:hypothetical protein [Treponema sp.]
MSEEEAWELDELLTRTTPEVDPAVQGPFIKHRNTMVIPVWSHVKIFLSIFLDNPEKIR